MDIVRVIHRRKLILSVVLVLSILAGVTVTAFTTPVYESTATIVPLEFQDIISNWLESRKAGEVVVTSLGGRVEPALFPDRWDGSSQQWTGARPSAQEAGAKLVADHVEIATSTGTSRSSSERFVRVTVAFPDPVMARDVANAYIGTLNVLRPHLENITRQEAFDKYYDGSNEQAAQQRAEVTARQKAYWLTLDTASLPSDPVKPNSILNLALASVLGLVLGLFAVFLSEWVSKYRAEIRQVEVPADAEQRPPEGPAQPDKPATPRARF